MSFITHLQQRAVGVRMIATRLSPVSIPSCFHVLFFASPFYLLKGTGVIALLCRRLFPIRFLPKESFLSALLSQTSFSCLHFFFLALMWAARKSGHFFFPDSNSNDVEYSGRRSNLGGFSSVSTYAALERTCGQFELFESSINRARINQDC